MKNVHNQHTHGPWIASLPDYYTSFMPEVRIGKASIKIDTENPCADSRLIGAAPEMLAALERLAFAAQNRDNTMGDVCRLIECKAELRAAEEQATAIIKKAKGE